MNRMPHILVLSHHTKLTQLNWLMDHYAVWKKNRLSDTYFPVHTVNMAETTVSSTDTGLGLVGAIFKEFTT